MRASIAFYCVLSVRSPGRSRSGNREDICFWWPSLQEHLNVLTRSRTERWGNSNFLGSVWSRQKRDTKVLHLFLKETGLGEDLKHWAASQLLKLSTFWLVPASTFWIYCPNMIQAIACARSFPIDIHMLKPYPWTQPFFFFFLSYLKLKEKTSKTCLRTT